MTIFWRGAQVQVKPVASVFCGCASDIIINGVTCFKKIKQIVRAESTSLEVAIDM